MNNKGKFIFLGSSVTYGSAAGGKSFVEYLAEKNNIDCIKEAVSGTTLVDNGKDSYIQRMVNNIDKNIYCEHFICQLSTNDAAQNLLMGKISFSMDLKDFDTSTIIGAIEYIICYAKGTWKCPVWFYTGTFFDCDNYQRMVDNLYLLKSKWNIGIIDLWNNRDMRSVSKEKYNSYMADPIHPTSLGYRQWWLPVFENELLHKSKVDSYDC